MEPLKPSDRFSAVNEILAEALGLPAEERSRFLEKRCAGSPALQDSVARLLGRFDELGDFLETPLAPAEDLQHGEILASRFQIVRKLGSGGMGDVYQAQDQTLQEQVAVKLIRRGLRDDPETESRFRDEIRLARRVSHPNVCRVFDVFAASRFGSPILFFTMEFLDGETLADRLESGGRLSPELGVAIAAQIGAGLDAAHRTGILHRDLKPSNVMLIQGTERAVIADFGLARAADAPASRHTQTGEVRGSLQYMAPEQMLGDPVSTATDLYSFGLIIFEMIAGRRPFPDETVIRTAVRRIAENAPSLSSIAPSAPQAWNLVFERALSRDPSLRPKSAGELIDELNRSMSRHWPSRRVLLRSAFGAAGLSASAVISRFYVSKPIPLPDNPVLMFANASKPGSESQAANAFALLVERQLNAGRIVSVTPARVQEIWARMHGDRTPIASIPDPRTIREISARAGANLVAFTGATQMLGDWRFLVRLELLGQSPAGPVKWWEHEFKTGASGDQFTASIDAARWVSQIVRATAPPPGFRQRTPQELTTSSWEALQEFTLAADSHNDPGGAIRHLKTALYLDPEFALAASRMADILNGTGRIDEGLIYYARAADLVRRRNLTDLESLRMQTLFALDTGQATVAVESASRWAAEAPTDLEPLVHEATALEWISKPEAARHLLDRAIELKPGSRSPRMTRARLALRTGDFEGAQRDCDHLMTLQPASATWQLKGALDFARLDFAGAWHALEQMLRAPAETTRSTAYSLQACHRAEQGRYTDSERILTEGIRFERERASTSGEIKKRRLLAQLLLLDHRISGARDQCQLALAANPGHAGAMEIGCVLAQAGDLQASRRCLRASLPDWPIYTYWQLRLRGEIALASGDAKKAVNLMSSVPPYPGYAESVWPVSLAQAAHLAGRRDILAPLLTALITNPARYWFNADFASPGFLATALDHYGAEIAPMLKLRSSAIRRALANST